MASPSPRRGDRRTRLLEAAARLFARWGFDKTSVGEIAREAGVSKGGVYLEFSTKEALFQAVLHRELGRYMEEWLRRFEADPGPPTFARMIQHSLAAIHAKPMIRAVMTRDNRFFGSFLRHDQDLISLGIAVRTELFRQLQEAGAMRGDIPPGVLAHLMGAIGYGLLAGDDVIPGDCRASFDDLMRALALLLDRGLAPRGRRPSRAARAILIAATAKAREAINTIGTDPPRGAAGRATP